MNDLLEQAEIDEYFSDIAKIKQKLYEAESTKTPHKVQKDIDFYAELTSYLYTKLDVKIDELADCHKIERKELLGIKKRLFMLTFYNITGKEVIDTIEDKVLSFYETEHLTHQIEKFNGADRLELIGRIRKTIRDFNKELGMPSWSLW